MEDQNFLQYAPFHFYGRAQVLIAVVSDEVARWPVFFPFSPPPPNSLHGFLTFRFPPFFYKFNVARFDPRISVDPQPPLRHTNPFSCSDRVCQGFKEIFVYLSYPSPLLVFLFFCWRLLLLPHSSIIHRAADRRSGRAFLFSIRVVSDVACPVFDFFFGHCVLFIRFLPCGQVPLGPVVLVPCHSLFLTFGFSSHCIEFFFCAFRGSPIVRFFSDPFFEAPSHFFVRNPLPQSKS